jgi:hypothetical protein
VFELKLGGSKTIYLAVEVREFTSGENPTTHTFHTTKRCAGQHAFSLQFNGKPTLFLTDSDG